MKPTLKKVLTLILTIGVISFNQAQEVTFDEIQTYITQKNFFKANEVFHSNKDRLSKEHQYFFGAIIDNAFNKIEESNHKIDTLLKGELNLPDSLMVKLFEVHQDNAVKLLEYAKAKDIINVILTNYKEFLSETEEKDFENSLKIWTALENTPKQTVTKNGSQRLPLEKDKAGLDNLEVSCKTISEKFIFDTGANISTVTKSTAQKLGMKLIPADIEVGTITGKKVKSQLAVSDKINLGGIEINNAVFLVFEDSDLYFEPIDYQINGIIGFPIINALEEIQITQDGLFIVPDNQTENEYQPNMALDGLMPLIFLNGKHYSFDSGAGETILYRPYYLAHKDDIEKNYTKKKVRFGGAGGHAKFKGYSVDATFSILDKEVQLKNIQLLTENIEENDYLYGNIGQDVIKQFNKMTLNFRQMFIRFD